MVRGVARGREHLPAEGLALGERDVRLGHRRELAPERVEPLAVEPPRRGLEPRRVDEVRRADRRDPDLQLRVLAHDRARGARMVEMDVREQQVADVGELEPALAKALLQPGERRRRPAVEQGGPVVGLDDVDADRVRRSPGTAGRPARARARAGTPTSAASRSAIRSSTFSIPTESRIRFRGDANGASAVEACVMRAGCSIRLSTPPSDSASEEELRPRGERDAPAPRSRPGRRPSRRSRASAAAPRRGRDASRGRGRAPARPPGAHRGRPRSRGRSRSAARILSASVFSPRRTSQASNGPGTAPSEFCRKRSRSASARVAREDGAADHVGVAAEVLRRRVDDEVGAERERLLQERGGEGVVDGEQRAGGVRGVGGAADVDDVEERVRRRLDPDELRVVVEVRGERLVELVGGHVREAVALRLVDPGGHPVHAAVDVRDQHHSLARDRRGA